MKIPRIVRDERGGAMVEFALVVPILMVLLGGIIEMGRAWNQYQVITDAAREGARRAVVRDGQVKAGTAASPGTVPSAILQRLANSGLRTQGAWSEGNYTDDCTGWSPPSTTITSPVIYGCGWGRQSGDEARVVIRAPYGFALLRPLLQLVGGTVSATVLESDYVMRNE